MNVTVQAEPVASQVLLVATARFHPSAAVTLQPERVLPSEVATWIEAALSAGWRPTEPGPTFTLIAEPSDRAVETILEEIDSIGDNVDVLHLWIPDALTLRSESVIPDVAMAIILDRVLAYELFPDGYIVRPQGRLCIYRRGSA